MKKSADPLQKISINKICTKLDEKFLNSNSESIIFQCNLLLKKPNHSKFCYAIIYETFMILSQVILLILHVVNV